MYFDHICLIPQSFQNHFYLPNNFCALFLPLIFLSVFVLLSVSLYVYQSICGVWVCVCCLYSLLWRSHYLDLDDLDLKVYLPASASRVLALKMCAYTPTVLLFKLFEHNLFYSNTPGYKHCSGSKAHVPEARFLTKTDSSSSKTYQVLIAP